MSEVLWDVKSTATTTESDWVKQMNKKIITVWIQLLLYCINITSGEYEKKQNTKRHACHYILLSSLCHQFKQGHFGP